MCADTGGQWRDGAPWCSARHRKMPAALQRVEANTRAPSSGERTRAKLASCGARGRGARPLGARGTRQLGQARLVRSHCAMPGGRREEET
eukprot:3012589-Rhodomonas_salina.1